MKKNKITTPLFFINHRIPAPLMVDLVKVAVRKIHTECSKSVVKQFNELKPHFCMVDFFSDFLSWVFLRRLCKHTQAQQQRAEVVAMLATGYVITSNPNAVKWSSSTFSVLSHYIAIKLSMYVLWSRLGAMLCSNAPQATSIVSHSSMNIIWSPWDSSFF